MILFFTSIFGLFLIVKVYLFFWNRVQNGQKLRDLEDLKKVYFFLTEEFRGNGKDEKVHLPKGFVLEDGWLYSQKFYFDMQDEKSIERWKEYVEQNLVYLLRKRKTKAFRDFCFKEG